MEEDEKEKIEEILTNYQKIDFDLEINKENMKTVIEIVALIQKIQAILTHTEKKTTNFLSEFKRMIIEFKMKIQSNEKQNFQYSKIKIEEFLDYSPKIKFARSNWSVENHSSYSKGFKNSIFSFVCCLKEKEMKIPKFVLFEILKNFSYFSFAEC